MHPIISKRTAVELITSSKGKFMTIKNKKRDGSDRSYPSSKYIQPLYGNLNVLTREGTYRNIRPETIYFLKTNGMSYEVA